MLESLTAHDVFMIGTGGVGMAIGMAALGLAHRAAPAVKAWFTKEKTTALGLEERVANGFAATTNAFKNALAGSDAKVRSDFQGAVNGLHTRLLAVEKLVGIPAPTAAP